MKKVTQEQFREFVSEHSHELVSAGGISHVWFYTINGKNVAAREPVDGIYYIHEDFLPADFKEAETNV